MTYFEYAIEYEVKILILSITIKSLLNPQDLAHL